MAEQDQARKIRSGAAPSLGELVAPLSVGAFFAQHWNQSFCAWPGRPGRFAPLIGWDEINDVLTTQRLEPPRLTLVRSGTILPADSFIDASGNNRRIDAGAMTAQLAQGATMVLSFIDEMVPKIGNLADRIAADTGARCNVNLYAGWRADHGFDLHWDHHDVFILQVAGRKHWRVHRPTRAHPARGEIVPPPADGDEPVFDGILEEGGILYIPRGWWHVATPVAEPSLHLTLALTPPTGQDYLHWLTGKSASDPVFRADWPVAGDGVEAAGHREAWQTALQALVQNFPPEAFLAEQVARQAARPLFTLPEFAAGQMARLSDSSRLRLASARALAPATDAVSGEHGLAIGERFFACGDTVGAALGRLSSTRDTRFAVLSEDLDESARRELEQMLIRLVAAGAVFVDIAVDPGGA